MPSTDTFRRAMGRATEPQVLFPLLAVIFLAFIWGTTAAAIRVRQSDAARAAAVSTLELLGTYEAQVVRALREIDQSLVLVKYLHEGDMTPESLAELQAKGLLPPDLLFLVSVADRNGVIIDSTRPNETTSSPRTTSSSSEWPTTRLRRRVEWDRGHRRNRHDQSVGR